MTELEEKKEKLFGYKHLPEDKQGLWKPFHDMVEKILPQISDGKMKELRSNGKGTRVKNPAH